jgi:hypothetical protein
MTKFVAKKRLKSAIKNRDVDGVKSILDWGLDNLTKCEYYSWFVHRIEHNFPFKDAQWFRSNFPIYFETDNGRLIFM